MAGRRVRTRRAALVLTLLAAALVIMPACAPEPDYAIEDPGVLEPGAPAPGDGDPDIAPDVNLPQKDATTIEGALSSASLETSFDPETVTQFETTALTATIVFGAPIDPSLETVVVAWSNEAILTGEDPESIEIVPTSPSRQFVDSATARPDGGYALAWTWDLTPLAAGEQTVFLRIIPTVVVDGEVIDDYADINEPIALSVDVHPVQQDLDEVMTAAQELHVELPETMTVGQSETVDVLLSLEGHADTIGGDLELTQRPGSGAVTISDAEPAEASSAGDDSVQGRWVVTAEEPGQVALVLTASAHGRAEGQELRKELQLDASTKVVAAPASFWEVIQQPVLYITPFVVLAATVVGLWQALKRKKAAPPADPES